MHILTDRLASFYLAFLTAPSTLMMHCMEDTSVTMQLVFAATNVVLVVPMPTLFRDAGEQEGQCSRTPTASARLESFNPQLGIPEVQIINPSRSSSFNPSTASDPTHLQVRDLRKQAQRAERQRGLESRPSKKLLSKIKRETTGNVVRNEESFRVWIWQCVRDFFCRLLGASRSK